MTSKPQDPQPQPDVPKDLIWATYTLAQRTTTALDEAVKAHELAAQVLRSSGSAPEGAIVAAAESLAEATTAMNEASAAREQAAAALRSLESELKANGGALGPAFTLPGDCTIEMPW